MGINGGRNRRGIEGNPEEEGLYLRVNVSMPPSLLKRLDKFMKDQDRPRSWCIQKAVDEWLKNQGF
jgi:predicted DNA-binding protein